MSTLIGVVGLVANVPPFVFIAASSSYFIQSGYIIGKCPRGSVVRMPFDEGCVLFSSCFYL